MSRSLRQKQLNILSAALAVFAALPVHSQLETDLGSRLSLSSEELKRIAAGDAVVKTLKTTNKQEVAILGIKRVSGPETLSLERFRSSMLQRGGGGVRPGGRFSTPPTPGDLDDLTLDKRDIAELAKCRVSNCDFNLSAESIGHFEMLSAEQSVEADNKYVELFRQELARKAAEYFEIGDAALGKYANRKKVVDLRQTHRELLLSSALLKEFAPAVYEQLRIFPSAGDHSAENELFWSTAEFGFKPMITISHLLAAEFETESGAAFVIVTKQIYASRYLDASLNFVVLTPGTEPGEYLLIFSDRSRSDTLGGLLGGLARAAVEAESTARVSKLLSDSAAILEAPPATETVSISDGAGDGTGLSPFDRLLEHWMIGLALLVAFAGLSAAIYRRTKKRPNR